MHHFGRMVKGISACILAIMVLTDNGLPAAPLTSPATVEE